MTTVGSVVFHCGLRVRSELELHLPRAEPGAPPDVEMLWGADTPGSTVYPAGTVIAEYFEGSRRLYTAVEEESGFRIRFPECGEFVISRALSSVTVHRDPAGPHASMLPVLAAGNVLSILHGLRGSTLLHASCVEVGGRALAIAGRSGQGKSTLAALLCAAGANLITDDVLLVTASPRPVGVGGATELRLRPSASSLALDAPFGSRQTPDERTAVTAATVITEPVPLSAVVVPIPSRETDRLDVVEIPPVLRVIALLAFPRIAGWKSHDVLTQQFETLTAVGREVPVYQATIPWGPPFDPTVVTAIGDLVRR
jgi:hypothetical protein